MRTRVVSIRINLSCLLYRDRMNCNTGCWIAAPLVTRRCAMLTYLFMVPTNSVMQWRVGWCGDGEIPPAAWSRYGQPPRLHPPQLTATSLASSRTLEAASVLSPRRWLFRGTPTQHKQLSGAWRYNPAAVQWKHFENK